MYTVTHGPAIKLSGRTRRDKAVILLEEKKHKEVTMSNNPQPTFASQSKVGAKNAKPKRQQQAPQQAADDMSEYKEFNRQRLALVNIDAEDPNSNDVENNHAYTYHAKPPHKELEDFKPIDLYAWWGRMVYEGCTTTK